jgi:hypothetical protein
VAGQAGFQQLNLVDPGVALLRGEIKCVGNCHLAKDGSLVSGGELGEGGSEEVAIHQVNVSFSNRLK